MKSMSLAEIMVELALLCKCMAKELRQLKKVQLQTSVVSDNYIGLAAVLLQVLIGSCSFCFAALFFVSLQVDNRIAVGAETNWCVSLPFVLAQDFLSV